MEFEELLLRARQKDTEALLKMIEMYRPLMIKYAVVDKKLDEDQYQELVYCLLVCIMKFPYTEE